MYISQKRHRHNKIAINDKRPCSTCFLDIGKQRTSIHACYMLRDECDADECKSFIYLIVKLLLKIENLRYRHKL